MNITEDDSIPDFPMFLYLYNLNGLHNGKIEIKDNEQLVSFMNADIRNAIQENRTVIITDVCDFCIFRAEKGRVIWPMPKHQR